MSNGKLLSSWDNLTSEETFRLSQAEFKGVVLQALSDIKEDIREIKNDQNTTRHISMFIAGLSGILSGKFLR